MDSVVADFASVLASAGNPSAILIGGTSNVGKSILATQVAAKLGCQRISTDSLARHPGRPWGSTRKEGVEYFLQWTVEELVDDVLQHYGRLWPKIESMVRKQVVDVSVTGLVVEGSALWPRSVATLQSDHVAAIWLTASPTTLEARIHAGSDFERTTGRDKDAIRKFLARTIRFNELMMLTIKELGLPSIDVDSANSSDELVGLFFEALAIHRRDSVGSLQQLAP